MRVGIAHDVEPHGVVEHLFVEVGRPVNHHHPLALGDLHPAQLGVGQRGALEGSDRSGPPDDLVDGGGRSQFLVELPLIAELGEGVHAVGDRVAGGLIARHGQQNDEKPEFVVGKLVPLHVGLNQLGDQVVARVGGAVGGHLHGVHDQLDGRAHGVIGLELRIDVADHLVGPVEEFLALLLRHPHQARDGLQWKLAGNLFDEISGALTSGGLGDGNRPLTQFSPKHLDRAWREGPRDDLAQVGVMRGVHIE